MGEAAENVARIKEISFQQDNRRIAEIKKITDQHPDEQVIIWCSYRDELEAEEREKERKTEEKTQSIKQADIVTGKQIGRAHV